jgi:hypothetical protein
MITDRDHALAAGHVSATIGAVLAIEQHLTALLGYTDALALSGGPVTPREMTQVLLRALCVLRVLHEEVDGIQLVSKILAYSRECGCPS